VNEFYRVADRNGRRARIRHRYDRVGGPVHRARTHSCSVEAKFYGEIDIDKMAGPSEVACDRRLQRLIRIGSRQILIAQAEHGAGDEALSCGDLRRPRLHPRLLTLLTGAEESASRRPGGGV